MEKIKKIKKTSLEGEFVCDKCQKEFEEICSFSQYGSSARNSEYLKGSKYCDECFKKVEEEIS